MTTEEKELLLKDLCARLPYGVKVNIWEKEQEQPDVELEKEIDKFIDGFGLKAKKEK